MILDTIANATGKRVEKAKERLPLHKLKEALYDEYGMKRFHNRAAFAFEENLKINMAFICEVKKASPSKGIIAEKFPYREIAVEYEKAGAAAISVLTEPKYFQGRDRYLTEISGTVELPVLRKDFIIDEYQIYEAKKMGADAVLLICALLSADMIRYYLKICDELGMSALVEVHDENEVVEAVEAGARIIGVNNRNLKTFEVDIENAIRLRSRVPEHILFIAESGISTPEDIGRLRAAGVNGVLIGETLMRSKDKKRQLEWLRNGAEQNIREVSQNG